MRGRGALEEARVRRGLRELGLREPVERHAAQELLGGALGLLRAAAASVLGLTHLRLGRGWERGGSCNKA